MLGTTSLALAVGSMSLLLLVACLTATLMEQHLTQRAVQELNRMRLMSNLAHEVLLVHQGRQGCWRSTTPASACSGPRSTRSWGGR